MLLLQRLRVLVAFEAHAWPFVLRFLDKEHAAYSPFENAADGAAVLDNSFRYPQMINDWFINLACSRQVRARLNRSALRAFSPLRIMRVGQSKGGVCATSSDSCPSHAARAIFHLPLPRSEPCRMAKRQ